MGQLDRTNSGIMRISNQDRKDLDKYTKFLAYKATQIIVQSRINQKISTACLPPDTPNLGNESVFNLHISDYPDVTVATKKALNGDIISSTTPLSIEISLQTTEGDNMVLEYWCLKIQSEQFDPTVKVNYTVYNRMGILLKSLVSVTRVTPAYKLSRRQGAESYLILYRIFSGEPQLHCLGDEYKDVRIGQICTPIGTLQLNVSYRTKMTISPTQAEKNNSIMLKSDHFNANTNTRRHKNNEDITDLTKPMRAGPFANTNPKLMPPSELPDVTRLLSMGKYKQRLNSTKSEIESDEKSLISEESEISIDEGDDNKNDDKNQMIIAKNQKNITTTNSSIQSTIKNDGSGVDDEYWMQELNAPFATLGPVGELMQFYRECKKSPPLQSPQKTLTEDEVTKMIQLFESQLPEYDAVVQSFCESPEDDN